MIHLLPPLLHSTASGMHPCAIRNKVYQTQIPWNSNAKKILTCANITSMLIKFLSHSKYLELHTANQLGIIVLDIEKVFYITSKTIETQNLFSWFKCADVFVSLIFVDLNIDLAI